MLNWLKEHGLRLLLNLLAWSFLIYSTYLNGLDYMPPEGNRNFFYLHAALFFSCYIVLINLNLFWLMPRYLFRKRQTHYLVLLVLLVIITGFVMGHYSEWLRHRFPGADSMAFSSITFGQKEETTPLWQFCLMISPTIFLTVFIFAIGNLAQQYFKVARQKELIEQEQAAAELRLLRSQINPHFLFNVLNSIYALSLKKSDQTPDVVLRLSEIMRYMLYEARNERVDLEKEVQLLHDYIRIEQMRLTSGQRLHISFPDEVPKYRIAPVLLLPFIENAVKHGTDSLAEHAFIELSIRIEQEALFFHCRNNYKKRPAARDGGIGLENVRKRLELLYPGRHNLTITDKDAIFDVSLILNLRS